MNFDSKHNPIFKSTKSKVLAKWNIDQKRQVYNLQVFFLLQIIFIFYFKFLLFINLSLYFLFSLLHLMIILTASRNSCFTQHTQRLVISIIFISSLLSVILYFSSYYWCYVYFTTIRFYTFFPVNFTVHAFFSDVFLFIGMSKLLMSFWRL